MELLTAIIAVFVAYIGYQQWRTAENKRKQDLFDRRWDFYCRAKKAFLDDLLLVLNKTGKRTATDYIVRNYIEHYADEAFFLFGEVIEHHISNDIFKILEYRETNTIKDPVLSFRKPFEPYLKLK